MRLEILLLIFLTGTAAANQSLQIGDGQIDASKLKPYEMTWRQCSARDGSWIVGDDLTEKLVVIGDHLLRVEQISTLPDGSNSVATTYFDRHSFAPLRMEQTVISAGGTALGSVEYALSESGYEGRKTRGDQFKDVQGAANSKMLHGGAMGLSLATLVFQDEPLDFAASMINFDATYKVTATWVGKEKFEYEGSEIEAWLVDIEWLHEGLGDVYPPGPDASGGRYWIVNNPPAGFPYVPRYKTDTYAVEFVDGYCPQD